MIIKLFLLAFTFTAALFAGPAEDYRENLSSDRDIVRRQAVYGIIHSSIPAGSAVSLLSKAYGDKDVFTKRLAISGLGKYAAQFSAEKSTSAFDGEVSTSVVKDYAKTPAEKAIEILRTALGDETAIIRADAVRALAGCKAEVVKDDIIRMLDDKNFIVLKEVMRAVSKLGITEASETIIKFLEEKSEIIRLSAVQTSADMKLKDAYKTVIKIAKSDRSEDIRLEALAAVVEIAPPSESLVVLTDFLDEDSIKLSLRAAFLLAKNSDFSGWKVVKKASKESDPDIRMEAAKILLYYDDEKSRDLLKSMRDDPDEAIRNFVKNNVEVEK